MTDVADWSGVTAGDVTLVSTVTINAAQVGGSFRFTINVANLPATTRSLLLLVLPTVVGGATTGYSLPTVIGGTTKQTWQALGAPGGWEAQYGSAVPVAGAAMAPLYFPAYGLVDPTATIQWTVFGGGITDQVEYWLLAMPDADLNGSTFLGMTVTNPLDYVSAAPVPLEVKGASAGGVLPVIVEDGTGTQQGTSAHPLHVTDTEGASTAQFTNLTTADQLGVAPPAAGFRRVVTAVSTLGATAGDTIVLGVNGAGNFAFTAGTPQVLSTHIVITPSSSGLFARNNTAARGQTWYVFHDEAL